MKDTKKKIYVINGANLNLLGIREPAIYGKEGYAALCSRLSEYIEERGYTPDIYQSNHEGDIVDRIQSALRDNVLGIVINPGGYTHTSVAIPDALSAVSLPAVEVHISDPDAREEFRHVSYIRPVCVATVKGHGVGGYFEAVDFLIREYGKNES